MINAVVRLKDNSVILHSQEVETVGKKFPKGFYNAETDGNGNINIKEKDLKELHTPYDSEENKIILETVKNFYKNGIKDKINTLGFIHKLGILMYGIAGTGKSSLMTYIADYLVKQHDGIVFFCNNGNSLGTAIGLSASIREIQGNPIVFIADEFERYANDNESEMKNFLDGVDSVENSLFLAATNYVDRVPNTLKERPSRFRLVQEIKGITDKQTMYDLTNKISKKISPNLFTEQQIKDLYRDRSCATVDEIKNICLDKITQTIVKKDSRKPIGFLSDKPENKDNEKLKISFDKSETWFYEGEGNKVNSYKENVKTKLK